MSLQLMSGIAAFVVAGAVAASCGGDSGAAASGEGSKQKYLERANRLCREVAPELEALAEESFEGLESEPSDEIVNAYALQAIALQRQRLDELRSLSPPAGDEQIVAEIYDQWAAVLDELEAHPNLPAGRPKSDALARFEKLAADYGLTDCAPR